MRNHPYRFWGLGHDSHPEDPQGCCHLPKDHSVHDVGQQVDPRTWPGKGDAQ